MNKLIGMKILLLRIKRNVLKFLPDEIYLRLLYRRMTGEKLNLKEPKTFNEKIQWLKLHDRRQEYTQLVDKYEVKKIVAEKIGEQYIIPTLGVWNHFDEINFDALPNQFVLKCTHDSGSIVIVKDKAQLNKAEARKILEEGLGRNYYYSGREWPYKNVKPRIIAEKYMIDESGIELKDYKVFNFDGVPKFIQVDFGRFTEHKRNLYTLDWEYIDAAIKFPNDREEIIEKPEKLEEMLFLSKKLSYGMPHVRTDFYSINDRIYFGELTFYHGSGFEKFTPDRFGEVVGSYLKLPMGKDT